MTSTNCIKSLSDIEFKDFMKSHIFFWVNDAILPSDNPLTFRKNLLKINM